MRMQRGGTACTAAADDEDIGRVLHRENQIVRKRALSFKQRGQLADSHLAGIRTELNWPVRSLTKVGVEFFDELIAVCRRTFGNRLLAPCVAGLVNDLLKRVNVHDR